MMTFCVIIGGNKICALSAANKLEHLFNAQCMGLKQPCWLTVGPLLGLDVWSTSVRRRWFTVKTSRSRTQTNPVNICPAAQYFFYTAARGLVTKLPIPVWSRRLRCNAFFYHPMGRCALVHNSGFLSLFEIIFHVHHSGFFNNLDSSQALAAVYTKTISRCPARGQVWEYESIQEDCTKVEKRKHTPAKWLHNNPWVRAN